MIYTVTTRTSFASHKYIHTQPYVFLNVTFKKCVLTTSKKTKRCGGGGGGGGEGVCVKVREPRNSMDTFKLSIRKIFILVHVTLSRARIVLHCKISSVTVCKKIVMFRQMFDYYYPYTTNVIEIGCKCRLVSCNALLNHKMFGIHYMSNKEAYLL